MSKKKRTIIKTSGNAPALHLFDFYAPGTLEYRRQQFPVPMKIMLIEEKNLLAKGLISLIKDWEELELVAYMNEAAGFMQTVLQTTPDIILMGLWVGNISCCDFIHNLARRDLHPISIVLASCNDDLTEIARAMRMGASGCVMEESMTSDRIRGTLWGAMGGEMCFAGVNKELLNKIFPPKITETNITEASLFETLTEREKMVAKLVMNGYSNAEIGKNLFLSEPTVKKEICRISEKIEAKNRAQIAAKAARYFVELESDVQ